MLVQKNGSLVSDIFVGIVGVKSCGLSAMFLNVGHSIFNGVWYSGPILDGDGDSERGNLSKHLSTWMWFSYYGGVSAPIMGTLTPPSYANHHDGVAYDNLSWSFSGLFWREVGSFGCFSNGTRLTGNASVLWYGDDGQC